MESEKKRGKIGEGEKAALKSRINQGRSSNKGKRKTGSLSSKKKKVLTLCINSPADNRFTDGCANTPVFPKANKILLGFGESKLMDHT